MESLILQKLRPITEAVLSNSQYGFRPGRSTEDALHQFRNIQALEEGKYVMAIFLDISNAFNTLWWPAIIMAVKKIGVAKRVVDILKDYLSNRLVVFRTKSGSIERKVNQGCPQGSVLGPVLWNLVSDDLIKSLEALGFKLVAFADDVVIIISGNSRKELEEKGTMAINEADNWCSNCKMKLSKTKTVMMLLKGKLDVGRPPSIKLTGKQISLVEEFRYLGVK